MATATKRRNPPLTRAQVRRFENVGLAPSLELEDLRFRWVYRTAKDFDVSGAISAVSLERTIEGASTLTVVLKDPDGRLASETLQHARPRKPRRKAWTVERDEGWDRILAPDEVGRAMEVNLDGARFRLVKASASYATSEITLTFEDLIVYLLKRKRNPALHASRKAITRAMFVQRLVREVQYIRPPFVCPDLYVRQPIDKPTDAGGGGGGVPSTNAGKAGNAINRRYPSHHAGASSAARLSKEQVRDAAAAGGFRGREITGMEQIAHGESDYYPGVISSDGGHGLWQMTPRVWGAKALAKLDALGGIAEMRNPTQNAKMAKFLYDDAGKKFSPWYGTKYLTVAAGPGAGRHDDPDDGNGGGEDTPAAQRPRARSYQYERKRGENSWAAIQRLAGEVNWRAFVVGEAFYFMSEERLFSRRIRYELTPATNGVLDLTYDVDWGKAVSEATLTVALDRWGAPPGSVVVLRGFGPPDGRWLVTSVRREWFSPVAEITLRQPGRQKNEPAHTMTTPSAGGAGGSDGDWNIKGSGGGLAALARIIGKFKGPYSYGGGHGPALSSLSYSQGLDCSSSTSLALFKAGFWDSRKTARTSGEFANWGKAGPGEHMTVVYGASHVFIAFHGIGKVTRFDTGGGSPPGPRPRYTPAWFHGSTRHWPGT